MLASATAPASAIPKPTVGTNHRFLLLRANSILLSSRSDGLFKGGLPVHRVSQPITARIRFASVTSSLFYPVVRIHGGAVLTSALGGLILETSWMTDWLNDVDVAADPDETRLHLSSLFVGAPGQYPCNDGPDVPLFVVSLPARDGPRQTARVNY
jgi:hypothetical protein